MAKIELNEQFQAALHLMEAGEKSLFITGKAGTGKSTLLSHFCKNAEHNNSAAFYLFPKLDIKKFNITDDQQFAMDYLHSKNVMVIPG
ncbi:MAG: hypothetical protein PHW76_09065, partial [Alphaproteobacteria bacterium]|nr:hypothetical protein [Alphaproteobacteria bacterium]